jgi:hypothetical protein
MSAQRDAYGRFIAGNTLGCLGAAVTVRRYRHKLSEWGRKGYEAVVNKHFNGNFDAANEWLARKGQHAQDQLNGYEQFYFTFPDPGPHPAHIQTPTNAEINASGELPF